MKKIVFGITGLTLGGAERVLIDIANRLSYRYDITIFTIYSKGELEGQLSDKIKLEHICNCSYNELTKFQKKIWMPLKILLNSKQLYNAYIYGKYDVEIAFLEGPITRMFSNKNTKTTKIAWIHNDISLVFGNDFKSEIKKFLDKKIYKKYKKLVFVSNDNLNKFNNIYKTKNEKKVVYNYIEKANVIMKANNLIEEKFEKEEINFVTVARLVEQKAIERLVRIHSKLIKNGLKHYFYIVGDGPLKEKIENLIEKEKVKETFILVGKKENPYPYIKNADYFCLLSNFEGYPMVIEEAKILDKFIVITDTAARETVKGYNKSKILKNDEQDIYIGLKEIIEQGKYIELDKNNKEYDNRQIIDEIQEIIEN